MRLLLLALIAILISCNSKTTDQADITESISPKLYLLYISSREQGFDIYRNDLNGNEIRLTENPGWDWAPLWVRGKNGILYNSQDTAGNFSLAMMDYEGSKRALNTFGKAQWQLSPNGDKVLFSQSSGDFTMLKIASAADPSDSLSISSMDSYNGRAKWSRDSQKVAYLSDRTGSNEIFIFSLLDSSTTQITDNKLREKYMSWSPDGSQLATTMASGEEANDIYLIDLESGETSQLTNTSINESEISWSPDGKYIAYHAKVDEKDDIFLIEVGTGEITKVTNGEGYHGEPEWLSF